MARTLPKAVDPRTPWNIPVIEGLFWAELVLCILTLGTTLAAGLASDAIFLTIFVSPMAGVALINSSTHIGVIRHGRPIDLGAIVGVNVLWAVGWVALGLTGIGFAIATIGSPYSGYASRGLNIGLSVIAIIFTFLSMIVSITICVMSIRALRRQKKGYIADPAGYGTGPKKFGIRRQRYELKESHHLGKMGSLDPIRAP